MALRFLVVEGNVRETREAYARLQGRTPGEAYGDVLMGLATDATFDVAMPADAGANLPDGVGLASYDGIALTGSALNIYEGGPEIAAQIELMRAAYASRTPVFGSCWGLQVATVAAGGEVAKNALGREVGFARAIVPSDIGRAHPLLAGRAAAFDAPCSHVDIVTRLPDGAEPLASNAFAAVQATEIRHDGGLAWAVQYHPEYALSQLGAIFLRSAASLVQQGFFAGEDDVARYAGDLRALDEDRARRDIAFRLGIQPEIIDDATRLTELRNWIGLCVRPTKSARGRA